MIAGPPVSTYIGLRSVYSVVAVVVLFAGVAIRAEAPTAKSGGDVLPAGDVIWVEAEQCEDTGGWKRDTQAIDQMGSPYLIATGIGRAVDDASTTVEVPEAGRYRLWARTRDWAPEHHPGRFRVSLGNRQVEHVFGRTGKSGWRWENAGLITLDQGTLKLRLQDLTGYYGRCDALILTEDLEWAPPGDVDSIARLRAEYGGVSPETRQEGPYEVVVVGGGLAGCTAAVAAARNGASVALIQNRPVLGGNASTEILVPPVGVWPYRDEHPFDPRETGIIEEYGTRGNQRVGEGKLYSQRLERFVAQEPDLDLFLNTHATGVEMAAGNRRRIAAVLAVKVRSGQRLRFPGKVFMDCTGDGVIGLAAGADHRFGKESKAMHQEPWAPEKPNDFTMGNGIKFFAREFDTPQPFEAPAWAIDFPSCDNFKRGWHPRLTSDQEIERQWRYELGGCRNPYHDAEEIRDDLLRLTFGLWDHIKNHCERYKDQAKNYRLVWVGHIAGKRESYRLMGDYILTQNDIGDQTLFPDRVAFGGWSVDDHHPAGFFQFAESPDYEPRAECQGNAAHPERSPEHHYKGRMFSIPFRSLYSRNVENLLMAGRNISATHLGMADTRVMHTCAVIGHAVGTASGMCVDKDTVPRLLGTDHIEALQQQLLKEGAYLIGKAYDDPDNLARKADVTASSVGSYEGERMSPDNVTDGFSRLDRGDLHAWLPKEESSGPDWVELSWDRPVTLNTVHVYFQTRDWAPIRFRVEAWKGDGWKNLTEVRQNRHRRHLLGLDRVTTTKLRIVESEPCGICAVRVYDEPKSVVRSARRAHETMREPDTGPFLPWNENLEPAADHGLPGVVVDVPGTMSAVRKRGGWIASTYTEPYIGTGYIHDKNARKGEKSVTFGLTAPEKGRYEIRLAYTAENNRATNTPVRVQSRGGSREVLINQREAPPLDGHFYRLATLALNQGQYVSVRVGNAGTDGYVVVDAVQMVPVREGPE